MFDKLMHVGVRSNLKRKIAGEHKWDPSRDELLTELNLCRLILVGCFFVSLAGLDKASQFYMHKQYMTGVMCHLNLVDEPRMGVICPMATIFGQNLINSQFWYCDIIKWHHHGIIPWALGICNSDKKWPNIAFGTSAKFGAVSVLWEKKVSFETWKDLSWVYSL